MKSERKWTAVLLNSRVRTSKPTQDNCCSPKTRSSLSYKCSCRETHWCPDLQFCSKEWAERAHLWFIESAQYQRSSTWTAQLCATVCPVKRNVNPTSSLFAWFLSFFVLFFFFTRAATSAGWLTAPLVFEASYCTSNLQPLCLSQVYKLPLRAFCLSDLWLFTWQMVWETRTSKYLSLPRKRAKSYFLGWKTLVWHIT